MKNGIAIICLLLFSLTVKSQTVYKTPSGAKYHLGTCRMVKNVSQALSLSEAVENGLGACKICNPPQSATVHSLYQNKANGEASTVQCKGTTKKETRCKHRTRIANGYCFQHNPDR